MRSVAKRLDAELRGLGKGRRKMLAGAAYGLLEVKRGKHYVELGFGSLADYAKDSVDFSAWKTRDVIELAERAERLPSIRGAFEEGHTHWTKLRTIARVAMPEDEAEWLARAASMSSRALERAVAEARGEDAPKVKVTPLQLIQGNVPLARVSSPGSTPSDPRAGPRSRRSSADARASREPSGIAAARQA